MKRYSLLIRLDCLQPLDYYYSIFFVKLSIILVLMMQYVFCIIVIEMNFNWLAYEEFYP